MRLSLAVLIGRSAVSVGADAGGPEAAFVAFECCCAFAQKENRRRETVGAISPRDSGSDP